MKGEIMKFQVVRFGWAVGRLGRVLSWKERGAKAGSERDLEDCSSILWGSKGICPFGRRRLESLREGEAASP